jgi:Domain of unknown function (DUF4258)
MMQELLSKHAGARARQRGIDFAQIEAVLSYADRIAHRGGGTEYIWISKSMLNRLGAKTPEGVDTDRLKNVHVLIGSDGGIITVLRAHGRRCRISV